MSSIYLLFVWQKTKLLAVASKICKLFNKTIVYESKTGLKEINQYFGTRDESQIKYEEISPQDLYLGVDFLNDSYTLVDTPLADSPHCELVRLLSKGENIDHSEYIKRMLLGALDERFPIIAFYLNKNYFRSCYEKSKTKIEQETYDVLVYQIDGKYYIHDGKHRAAVCALNGIDVKCKVIDSSCAFQDFNKKKISRLKKSTKYSKHNNIFKEIDL